MRLAILAVIATLGLPARAFALPIEGLEALEWNMPRAQVLRILGTRVHRAKATRAMVPATLRIEGRELWAELLFDEAGLVRIYVAVGFDEDGRIERRLAGLSADRAQPSRGPKWIDDRTRATLSYVTGCHHTHVALWMERSPSTWARVSTLGLATPTSPLRTR